MLVARAGEQSFPHKAFRATDRDELLDQTWGCQTNPAGGARPTTGLLDHQKGLLGNPGAARPTLVLLDQSIHDASGPPPEMLDQPRGMLGQPRGC